MAKVECYNCKQITAVIAPGFRCSYCNYPLHRYLESIDAKKVAKEVDVIAPVDIPVVKVEVAPLVENKPKLDEIKVTDIKPDVILKAATEVKDAPIVIERLEPQKHKTLLDELHANLERIKQRSQEKAASHTGHTGKIEVKKNENPDKQGKLVAGWLVRHTESKSPITYELFEGDNKIGRPDGPHHLDIKIEDDRYISRVHCNILIVKDFLHRFRYELNESDGMSTNGTFINGIERRLSEGTKVFLAEGDNIQVGETKFVFKTINNSINHEEAASEVMDRDYTRTVAINVPKNL